MKKHISITIDEKVIHFIEKLAAEYHRSVSQVLELAALEYIEDNMRKYSPIPTTPSKFEGNFSRKDTYAER